MISRFDIRKTKANKIFSSYFPFRYCLNSDICDVYVFVSRYLV